MKKIFFLILLLALSATLTGCGRPTAAPQADQPEVNINTSSEAEDEVKNEQVAAKYNNIFFGSTKYDPEKKNCQFVYWVHIPGEGVDPLERNLKLLLAGPTAKWQEKGYYTNIPEGTKLNWVKLENDTISADFSPELGSLIDACAISQVRQQIENTLRYTAQEYLGKGIEDLKVVISVDGQTDVLK